MAELTSLPAETQPEGQEAAVAAMLCPPDCCPSDGEPCC